VFISDRAFWRPGLGGAARQREMLGFLVEQGPVDLIYLGTALDEFERLSAGLAASPAAREIRCEALAPTLDLRRAAARLGRLVADRWPSRVLVMSDDLAWVPDFVPATIPTLLDAEAADIGARLDDARLAGLIRRFDRVLFSREGDYARAVALLGEPRCGFSPYPLSPVDPLPPLRSRVQRIGVFFGDRWVDGTALSWLHGSVWQRPELAEARGSVEIVVGGAVGDPDLVQSCPGFRFVGPVDNAAPFFAAVDVVVAPQADGVAAAIGALGSARPLLATPQAVADLARTIGSACLLAEDPAAFARVLSRLIDDTAERRRLADAALALAEGALSPAACFRPLLDAPVGTRPSPTHADAQEPGDGVPLSQALNQGLAHQRAGRPEQAEQVFRRILAFAPEHPGALLALGTLLTQRGSAEEALPLLHRAAELRPGAAVGWNNLASALNALARFAEAEAAADAALALRDGYVEALLNRARARRGLNRAAEAAVDCEAALSLRPGAPELLRERGLARCAAGDPAAAVGDLKAAVGKRPEETAWAEELARLQRMCRADAVRRPRVGFCCRAGGLPPDWEPAWALPGIEACPVSADEAETADCDLLLTDDAEIAFHRVAAGKEVWLRGETLPICEDMRAFAAADPWSVADIAANLAVWVRDRTEARRRKAMDESAPEGYIPPETPERRGGP
jgi:tetratricopeptide (TPR) repeat protein